MSDWVRRVGINLFRRTDTRRGALGFLGRASTGLVAAGVALAAGGTAQAAEETAQQRPIRSAPPRPVLLPRGQRAALPAGCNSCSNGAEYVCYNCCAGDVCCSGSLYRQLCYDSACNPYYIYWCA